MAQRAHVVVEHQRLHGMGEVLYAAAAEPGMIVRAYAPVGGHEDLLPYLVRRLLENGANTSFVHSLLDDDVPAQSIVRDPVSLVEAAPDRHPRIPPPPLLYGEDRINPLGRDYSMAQVSAALVPSRVPLVAGPMVGGVLLVGEAVRKCVSPSDHEALIGTASEATQAQIEEAVSHAQKAQPGWDRMGGTARAHILLAMADALESETDALVELLAREAGKTLNDGVAEVREAIDFCRYYAGLADTQFGAALTLPGPVGETNRLALKGRGVFAGISPWNFPLAIFTGQIAAALAAGNAVLAKPAEQTPFIAARAVALFHKAGLAPDLLHLLPGDGARVGAALVSHPGVAGVAFTGGTETAWHINRAIAARPGPIIPFIAETGGLNAMFVDSTALKEQVVDDVALSAFGSAGQRCSALRLLFVPHDMADDLIMTLKDNLDTLVLGDPFDPATDIGPVIDAEAQSVLEAHVARLEREAKILHRAIAPAGGSFFGPVIAEIPSADFLEREVFGPILHICRYDPHRLEKVTGPLAAKGYGLTLGIHSRLDSFAAKVMDQVPAGNVYVNRAMTGAVVGVQPFGGEGLSGTGPKAGGPHALYRYATERTVTVNITAQGGNPDLFNL